MTSRVGDYVTYVDGWTPGRNTLRAKILVLDMRTMVASIRLFRPGQNAGDPDGDTVIGVPYSYKPREGYWTDIRR